MDSSRRLCRRATRRGRDRCHRHSGRRPLGGAVGPSRSLGPSGCPSISSAVRRGGTPRLCPSCVWLARVNTRAVGHAVLSVRYTMEHAALGGYVDDLFVAPDFRRQQVASRLLRALVDEGRRRGCASLYVEVGASNTAAIATYRRFGLNPVADGRLLVSGSLCAADN
jgi:GNAT superfamily N-acetyltransferase